MLRNENGMLCGYVYVDVAGRDIGSYVDEAKRMISQNSVALPPGYSLAVERAVRGHAARARAAHHSSSADAFLIVMLLYANTKSMAKTLIILLAVPFSAIGAIWLLHFLGYNMSIGVWVGLIALMGVDAETGVFMMLYLDLAYDQAKAEGRLRSLRDLQNAIIQGAVKRIRPKFMTVATMFLGLAPIMWSVGAGADVMKRIAAPMIGGIFTSFLLELVVYPAIYEVWKWHFELNRELARC
jgi:Cu(I)/Ag(I) efflux system membrane protein CusA/SilA